MTTIKQALADARHQLRAASPSPAVDASVLLCHVLECPHSHLIAWPDKVLNRQQAHDFDTLVQQRIAGQPVAYLTGEKEFWSLSLKVTTDVLIPRPETETLIEFVLENFSGRTGMKIADVGTGSGAIACALAAEHPQWVILATDVSAAALDIARFNASLHNLENITFAQGDWLNALGDKDFDLIISNPPYIANNDTHLAEGDVRFEPQAALTSGENGMDAITLLTQQSGDYLVHDGWLVVEHGYDQQQPVFERFSEAGFTRITQLPDLAGQPRMTAARYRQTRA
ncbi:MAG: peptide chain release factor N(5)-glutamine methyltransferase [Gammaproteobacteria bacterium]